ncbi:DASH complex subunit Dad3-domain-containing protein [Hysterangium stoloniferum]|nr:DASH complex subunit Dad3-domain-containing protein [Hysterangium stoloniferum]
MATDAGIDIQEINPYDGHPELSNLEADVLWEYAKLAKNVKTLLHRTRELSEAPDQALLGQLRVLERKLGLVLTLFKASVWAAINDKQAVEEEEEGYSYDEDETGYDRTVTT